MSDNEDRKAKILDRVRKLLAKAASTPFSEEAAALSAKADELMTAYAIEEWELAKKGGETQKPESRYVDISWWFDIDTGMEDHLWSLLWACARHARCTIIYWRPSNKTVPVVGMPGDLDYMDLLFTDLMIQMVGQLDPKPDPGGNYHEQLRRLREAGMSWPDAARKMLEAGFDPRPDVSSFKVKQDQMTRDYRTWCKKTGIPQNYNHYKTYGRNFASGFVSKVNMRMREMRGKTQSESDAGSSTALAIRDIKQVVDQAAGEMFGSAPRGRGSMVRDSRKVDFAAQAQGQLAGQSARIAGQGASLGGRQKQISK